MKSDELLQAIILEFLDLFSISTGSVYISPVDEDGYDQRFVELDLESEFFLTYSF